MPSYYAYVFADGIYFSVIYDGEGQKMPILALIGVTSEGQREVIAFTVGERENQGAWENLLADIKPVACIRSGSGLRMVTSY